MRIFLKAIILHLLFALDFLHFVASHWFKIRGAEFLFDKVKVILKKEITFFNDHKITQM
jgi:hypothetical protein